MSRAAVAIIALTIILEVFYLIPYYMSDFDIRGKTPLSGIWFVAAIQFVTLQLIARRKKGTIEIIQNEDGLYSARQHNGEWIDDRAWFYLRTIAYHPEFDYGYGPHYWLSSIEEVQQAVDEILERKKKAQYSVVGSMKPGKTAGR